MKILFVLALAFGLFAMFVPPSFGQENADTVLQGRNDPMRMKQTVDSFVKQHPKDRVRIWLYGSAVDGHIVAVYENYLVIEEDRTKLNKSITYSEILSPPERHLPIMEKVGVVSGLGLLVIILLPLYPLLCLFGGLDC
jgi:hypothetical protein